MPTPAGIAKRAYRDKASPGIAPDLPCDTGRPLSACNIENLRMELGNDAIAVICMVAYNIIVNLP